MADHTDNALRASIKALNDVVLPALDPADPLAMEQLRLVASFLEFLRGPLPYLHGRNRFELSAYLELGRRLLPEARLCSAEVVASLESGIAAGAALLMRADASIDAMQSATAELSAAISALVRVVASADDAVRHRVEQAVVSASKPLLDMERSWALPQGFELDAASLPPLASALEVVQQSPSEVAPTDQPPREGSST